MKQTPSLPPSLPLPPSLSPYLPTYLPGKEAQKDVCVEISLVGLVENEDGIRTKEEVRGNFLGREGGREGGREVRPAELKENEGRREGGREGGTTYLQQNPVRHELDPCLRGDSLGVVPNLISDFTPFAARLPTWK